MNIEHQEVAEAVRFAALWTRCCTDTDTDTDAIHAMLCARHAEPQRHYHSLEHIRHCLREFDIAPLPQDGRDCVEMALWFHDAIYQPGARDNEHASAELFEQCATGRMSANFVAEVRRLIMATTHREPSHECWAAWMTDIDLSSFGVDWPRFLRESRQVREEFGAQSDADYYARHIEFLSGFLTRERLYQTEHFFARYETAARANIHRLLAMLAAGERP